MNIHNIRAVDNKIQNVLLIFHRLRIMYFTETLHKPLFNYPRYERICKFAATVALSGTWRFVHCSNMNNLIRNAST